MSGFIRPLGGIERTFHSYSVAYPVAFSVVVELSGWVDGDGFRAALLSLQKTHPFLSVIVKNLDEIGLSFIQSDEEIPFRVLSVEKGIDWRKLVEEEISRRGYDGHNLARASLLQGAKNSTIVLTFAHVIADGRSGTSIALDLVSLLRGYQPVIREGLPDLDLAATKSSSTILPAPVDPGEAQDKNVIFRSARTPHLNIKTRFLDSIQSSTLSAHCRLNGVTVHGALLAASAIATAKVDGSARLRISSPVDLRPGVDLLPYSPGLFIALALSTMTPDGDEDFWKLAARSKEGIEASRSPEAINMLVNTLAAVVPMTPDSEIATAVLGPLVADLMISNLGVVPEASCSHPLQVQALWAPVLNTQVLGNEMIGVATYGGKLRMTHVSESPDSPLLDNIIATLLEAVNLHPTLT